MDQHFVTRFYLEGFCDPITPARHEPSVWECDLPEGTIKRRAPKNVATEADYYSVTDESGNPDHWAERLLSEVESAAAPVVRKLRAGNLYLSWQEREWLALFVAFLIVRVPSFRDYLERTAGKLGESMLRVSARRPTYFEETMRKAVGELPADEIEELRKLALDPAKHFEIRGTREHSLGHALRVAMKVVRLIHQMRWEFVVAKETCRFITGDTPVTWRNPSVRPLGEGLGLKGTELSFPLSPSVCLVGTWIGKIGVSEASDARVQDLNRERVRQADRFVYADSEASAREALKEYAVLQEAGEAHARPFKFFIIEEGKIRGLSN